LGTLLLWDTWTFNSLEEIANIDPNNLTAIDACNQSCCNALSAAQQYCNNSESSFAYNTFSEIIYYHQARTCVPAYTCNFNISCISTLGLVNAKLAPLQNAMFDCGFGTDLNDISDSGFNVDGTKACTKQCCSAVDQAATPCNSSTLYALFSGLLVHYQDYECQNFQCNITATIASSFSIAGLPFLTSVGVCIAIAIGGLIFVIVAIVLICKR